MNIVTLDLPPKGEEQRMLIETTFYYLRHGETDWNRQRRFQGQVDNPLNAVGAEQARAASEQVRNIEIKTIYASPLRRAIETARYFQTALGCRLDVIDDLKEATVGVREGTKRGAWCEEWKAGALMPEGAEKYDDFIERALRGINQALAYPGPVLIVSHEMVYHALRPYTGLGPDYILPHCRVVRHDPPVVAGQKWQVITL